MQVWLHLSRGVRRLMVHPIYIMYRCSCSLSMSNCVPCRPSVLCRGVLPCCFHVYPCCCCWTYIPTAGVIIHSNNVMTAVSAV